MIPSGPGRFKAGFTLQELLEVFVIIVVIITGALTVYLLCYRSWQEATLQASLQREGNVAMDKLIRGVRGDAEARQNGLREAKSYTIPFLSNDSIEFVSGVDDIERSFYLSDDQIMYDPNTLIVGDEIVAAEDIETLSFVQLSSRRIRVNIVLNRAFGDKSINLNLETDVTIRN